MTVCTTCQHANNYNNAVLFMGRKRTYSWVPESSVFFFPFKLTAGKKITINYSYYLLGINRGMGTKPKPYGLQLKKI
jgi:hypothetical protein